MSSENPPKIPNNKVSAAIEKYGLHNIGQELESKWLGEAGNPKSVRDVTEFFNKRIVESAMADEDVILRENEIDDIYEAVIADSPTNHLEARERVEATDVTLDTLKDDFVSHQTMYRYLTQVRQASKETPPRTLEEQIATTKNAGQKLRGRLNSVLRVNLDNLRKKSGFVLGDFEVTTSITISCNDCQSTKSFLKTLQDRGCECPHE